LRLDLRLIVRAKPQRCSSWVG